MNRQTQTKTRTVKRACNYCKKKHIKCDGRQPCYQCERRDLKCEYSLTNVAKKKKEEEQPSVNISTNVEQTSTSELKLNSKKRKVPEQQKKREMKFKFISSQSKSLSTTCHLMKNPPDGSWLVAYNSKVAPFVSDRFKLTDISQFHNTLNYDYEKLNSYSIERLSQLLSQLVLVAHGSRYCFNFEVSVKSIYKALDVIDVLHKKKAHTYPQCAQNLAVDIESAIFYLAGHGDMYKTRELASHSKYILENFGSQLSPSTKRSVYSFLIGKSNDLDEIKLWYKKACQLPTDGTSQADVSSWVVLAMFLMSKPLITGDNYYYPPCEIIQTQEELDENYFILSVLEHAERYVWNYESLVRSNEAQKIAKIFKLVLFGHKAFALCRCGLIDDALAYANEVIQYGKPDKCRLPFIMSLFLSCLVCKHANKLGLYYQGFETLTELAEQYPQWKNALAVFCKRNQMKPFQFELPMDQPVLELNEVKDESDTSTIEYRSPITLEEPTTDPSLFENEFLEPPVDYPLISYDMLESSLDNRLA